jgi:hypothetical protein
VGYQPVEALDIDDAIQSVLDQRYTATEVDGQPVWQLKP